MSKYTPGPWAVQPTPRGTYGKGWREIQPRVVFADEYQSSRDGTVCGVYINEANAQLIASAPELLASLQELRAMCERQRDFNDDGDGKAFDRADAAIAKATGVTNA